MDFEPKQKKQEFEIKEDGTVVINGSKRKEYGNFYESLQRKNGSPKKFFSIFSQFIIDCGFNLRNQSAVINDTALVRGLKDTLPAAGSLWTIWSDLDFRFSPDSVNVDCLLSLGGTSIKKEKADQLLRLALITNFPKEIRTTARGERYQINIADYSQLKTSLILLVQKISATNDIIFVLSEAIDNLLKSSDIKEFLKNLP